MAAISGTDAVAAVVAILLAGAVLLGSMYGFRYAFTYRLENSRLDIRILGLPSDGCLFRTSTTSK